MGVGIKAGAKQGMLGMLSLQEFVKQVVHYITFSIGVQLVMGIKSAFDYMIDTFKEFEQQAIRTAAVTGRLDASFDDVVQSIMDVSTALADTSVYMRKDVVRSMYDFASAGFDVVGVVEDVKNGVETFAPVLDYAAGQQIELTEATDLVSTTLKQFGLELSETPRVVDTFTAAISNSFLTNEKLADMLTHVGAVANTFGLSLEETTAAGMAVADAGFRASTGGRALRMIMLKLVDPSEKAKKALADIGLTMQDLNPAAHSFSEILYTLKTAGFDAATAAKVFRARTAGVATSLVESASSVTGYQRALESASGITEDLATKNEQSFAGSLAMVMAKLDKVAGQIGAKLAPVIKSLANYIIDVVVPSLRAVYDTMKAFAGAIKPVIESLGSLKPILKVLFPALITFIGLWASLRIIMGIITLKTLALAKAKTIAAGANIYLSSTEAQFGAITLANTGGLLAYVKAKYLHIAATFKSIMATNTFTAALLACPLTWIAVGLAAVVAALVIFGNKTNEVSAEQKKWNNQLEALKDTTNEVDKSMDTLINAIDAYSISQGRVNDLVDTGKIGTEEYTDALAEQEEAMQNYKDAQREFLNNLSSTVDYIADKNDKLANYINTRKKVNSVESQALSIDREMANKMELIDKAYENRIKMQKEYGSNSVEYQSALSREVTLKKNVSDLEKQLIGETGELTDEQKRRVNTIDELNDQYDSLNKTMDDTESVMGRYNSTMDNSIELMNALKGTNALYANIVTDMMDLQQDYNQATDEYNELLAKENVLQSNYENLQENVIDAVGDLVDAQLDLYDIEEKIYKLRNGQVDETRELFDALANQGALTKDIISLYSGMEQAQGNSLAMHIKYTKALDNLGSDQKGSVMEWTTTYINSLDDGLSSTQAFIRTNSELGKTLKDIPGVSDTIANSVLEYAEAEHEARYGASQLKNELSRHSGALVDNEQASNDTTEAYYDLIDTNLELAEANVEKQEAEMDGEEASEKLADTVSRLGWHYINTRDDCDTFIDAVELMVDELGIANVVGGDQQEILDGLNTKYGRTEDKIGDYTDAEVLAYLAGGTLVDTLGDTSTEISNVKDSTKPAIIEIGKLTKKANILKGKFDALDTDFSVDFSSNFGDLDWENIKNMMSTIEGSVQGVADANFSQFNGLVDNMSDMADYVGELADKMHDFVKYTIIAGQIERLQKFYKEAKKEGEPDAWKFIVPVYGAYDYIFGESAEERKNAQRYRQQISDMVDDLPEEYQKYFTGFAKGGIVGLQSGIAKTVGPQLAMIGEAGAEAVVPLEGINKKYGRAILGEIIPEHFPEFGIQGMQTGGVVGTPTSVSNTTTNSSRYIIEGDINVYGVQDVEEFMDELIRELEDRRRMVRD